MSLFLQQKKTLKKTISSNAEMNCFTFTTGKDIQVKTMFSTPDRK